MSDRLEQIKERFATWRPARDDVTWLISELEQARQERDKAIADWDENMRVVEDGWRKRYENLKDGFRAQAAAAYADAAKIIYGLAAACDAEIEAATDDYHRDFWMAQRGQLKRGAAAIEAAAKEPA